MEEHCLKFQEGSWQGFVVLHLLKDRTKAMVPDGHSVAPWVSSKRECAPGGHSRVAVVTNK